MVYTIQDIVSYLEKIAPPSYQESYDNAQLITGNPKDELKGVLCSLDATEAVVDEAIDLGCNMIVAHHPIVFKGLKSFTGKNYVEKTIVKAIKNDIAIFAIHTNLDHVAHGVNKKICDILGLNKTRILRPKKELLSKLVTFCPIDSVKDIQQAMFAAGAGTIGEYSDCSFQSKGIGTFTPSEKSKPYKGQKGEPHEEEELRIEVLLPSYLERKVLAALKEAHPYEEVAYFITKLENENQEVGAGMIGELDFEMDEGAFFSYLKKQMELVFSC
jgi:putative NIF3 family GTP cyclohydrolase 1 type 2